VQRWGEKKDERYRERDIEYKRRKIMREKKVRG